MDYYFRNFTIELSPIPSSQIFELPDMDFPQGEACTIVVNNVYSTNINVNLANSIAEFTFEPYYLMALNIQKDQGMDA